MLLKSRGGQPHYVIGRDKRPIVGMSCSSGRYYATHSQPRRWFGRDFDKAVILFREWETDGVPDLRPDLLAGNKVTSFLHSAASQENEMRGRGVAVACLEQPSLLVRDDVFWSAVRDAITDDPREAANRTGLPLDRLHVFTPPPPSIRLDVLRDLYEAKPNMSPKARRDILCYWDEFTDKMGVKTVAEISAEMMERYCDEILTTQLKEKRSPSYVKNRFDSVKIVLRYAAKRAKDVENVNRVVTFCQMLVPPKRRGVNPQPISRKDFAAVLKAADPKWRAILLLSLNAAYYPIDIANLRKSAVDLKAGTMRDSREKTGVPRVAVLWKRTIQAIQKYQRQQPHHSDYVFISATGDRYTANHIGRNFRRIKKRTTVGKSVEFCHIRDGSQTAAIEGGADPIHVDFLLGHRAAGVRDNYLMRKPTMVKDACEAIERYYFGKD